MNSDSGYRLRLPETSPEGCSMPDSLRAFIEQSTIESPVDVENGGGTGDVTPLDFNAVRNQVTNNSNDIIGLNSRVTALEARTFPKNGSVTVPAGATSINFQVSSDGTHLDLMPIGGPLDNLWISGPTGSVTAHWTTAAGTGIVLSWSQS